MGAFAGSLTFTKFYVRGELPDDHRNSFMRRIRHRVFRPLTPDADEEERYGWCGVGSPLDLELRHEGVFCGSYLNLAFRVDRWRIPGALATAHLAEAERALLAKKGEERLGRTEKKELKAKVALALKKQLLPQMQCYDFSWNLDRGTALFWCQSKSVQERLAALFEATFALELAADSPYVAALERGLSSEQKAALNGAQQTVFCAAPPVRKD